MKSAIEISILFVFLFVLGLKAQAVEERLKRQALRQMQVGNYGEAIVLLNKYVTALPRNPEGYYLRGLNFEKRKQYFSAVLDYRRAISLKHNYTDAIKALSRTISVWYKILLREIEGYKREIKKDPRNPFNYLEIGKRYRWMEEWEMAEMWYDRYLARDKNASPDEIIRYTIILTKTGHIKKGERILKIYVNRYPEDWRLWSRYGYFTMWLGNYKTAQKAFEKALSFKPFFQEALDGLDLAKHQGYLTQFQPQDYERVYRRGYPIDIYYRRIKKHPDDYKTRFKLVEELIKAKRYEEAYRQLRFLKDKFAGKDNFELLWKEVNEKRTNFYKDKITLALEKLQSDPNDKKAIRNLAQYYSNLEAYSEAEEMLSDYLKKNPADYETRYLYARVLSLDGKFEQALGQIDTVLVYNSIEPKYKLLAAQLNIWSNTNLDVAENYLKDVLKDEPNNLQANISMGTLYFQKDDIGKAQYFANLARAIDSTSREVKVLQSMINGEKIRQREHEALKKLDVGRKLAMNGKCAEALPYYQEYLNKYGHVREIEAELVDVYICNKQYNDALDLLNRLLDEEYEYKLDKKRAETYFWSGDTSEALVNLERLSHIAPEDKEVKLYLGDVYALTKQYEKAKEIYLSLKESAPKSYLIDQRLQWLPPEYRGNGFLSDIYNRMAGYFGFNSTLSAYSYLFADNINFNYYYFGTQASVQFFPLFSLSFLFNRNYLKNSFTLLPFNSYEARIFIRPFEYSNLMLGFGRQDFPNNSLQTFWEGSFQYDNKKNLRLWLYYTKTNAAVLLYSPFLLDKIFKASNATAYLKYYYRKLFTQIDYRLNWTDKNRYEPVNIGNYFQFRLGRKFPENLEAGLEYYFADYKFTSSLYYSPQTYDAYSVFAEWNALNDKIYNLKLAGKFGYVPIYDFILKELSLKFKYNIYSRLYLNITAYYSNNARFDFNYSSGSVFLNLLWKIK